MKNRILFAVLMMLMGYTAQVQAKMSEIVKNELQRPGNAGYLCQGANLIQTPIQNPRRSLRELYGTHCSTITGALLAWEICLPYFQKNKPNSLAGFLNSGCMKKAKEEWSDILPLNPSKNYSKESGELKDEDICNYIGKTTGLGLENVAENCNKAAKAAAKK